VERIRNLEGLGVVLVVQIGGGGGGAAAAVSFFFNLFLRL
jgi:hypothetical protein